MDIYDYARILDHMENRSGRPIGDPFCHVAYEVRTVRAAGRTASKVEPSRLGPQRFKSTAGDYTRRISKSAESQYFASVDALERRRSSRLAADVADVLADWS